MIDFIIITGGSALVLAIVGTAIELVKTLLEYSAVSKYKKYKLDPSRLESSVDGKNLKVYFEFDDDGTSRKGSFYYPVNEKAYYAWRNGGTELEVYLWEEEGEPKAIPTNHYSMNIKASLIIIGGGILLILAVFGVMSAMGV